MMPDIATLPLPIPSISTASSNQEESELAVHDSDNCGIRSTSTTIKDLREPISVDLPINEISVSIPRG